ncbi:hypothetical protein [Edaphobacter aggregans]|uniref:hypothetical protein n=1 Tax=Edaphobacter aggregans TaxID=570835 RepID=UPI00054D8C69|nr:hypothetical protein [Edaphobacter aggregans]
MRLRSFPLALIVFSGLGMAIPSARAEREFQFRFIEKPGPYAVGLKVIEQYDASRVFEIASDEPDKAAPTEGCRPLQMLVWYPAQKSSDKIMTFGDYAALIKTETSFGKPVESGKSQAFVEQYMHGVMALPASAVRAAPMQPGHFPLVIYAPSLNAPATENIEGA